MTSHPETTEGHAGEGFYDALLDDDAEALYERAPCGYVSAAPDGVVIKVNETFLTWTGYRGEDLVGQRAFVDLLSAGGRIYHETHYRPLLEMQGRVREIALEIVRVDGGRLPVLLNSVLERDERGHPVVIRTAIFDATERRRYERELLSAKQRAEQAEERARGLVETLQRSLLPPEVPRVEGLDLAAVYRPAGAGDELGGDFYDVFEAREGEWFLAVGDVRGKGVEAAIVTGQARDVLRAAAVASTSPRDLLCVLNEVLLRSRADRFVTVALLRLIRRPAGWAATVALGGHPRPLVCRGASPPSGIGTTGRLLGLFPTPSFPEDEVVLEPGDLLVAYTDGITEARSGSDWFGEDRLRLAVGRHHGSSTAAAAAQGILAEVMEFQGGNPRDDIVVVAAQPR